MYYFFHLYIIYYLIINPIRQKKFARKFGKNKKWTILENHLKQPNDKIHIFKSLH